MADDKLTYSDIIEPDGSLTKLAEQLGAINSSFETLVGTIKDSAGKISSSLKSASGATRESRESIDEAAIAARRLDNAYKELRIALTNTGKELAWVKAQTTEANRASVESIKREQALIGSYDKLKIQVKDLTARYKALSAEERGSEKGERILQQLLNKKSAIEVLNETMRVRIKRISELERAEARLAYLDSEEGQRLIELKRKIAELTSGRKEEKVEVSALAQAQERLTQAQSSENVELQGTIQQTAEANRIAKLQAQILASAEGSYNRLAAQYALNKVKLNQMSEAERDATAAGKALVEETNKIYQKMITFQEATGNFRLSVGNYRKTWDGLSASISQVVREMPALAVSANTFFLAISNNIPMVMDEINKLIARNKVLQAEGKKTVSIGKAIAGAMFSWNSVLVLILSVFSVWGGEIVDWIASLFKAKDAVISTSEAMENINKELKDTNNSFGKNVVTVKKLSSEWKSLKTTAEKNQWIKGNKSAFDSLDISIRNINEAENAFEDHTDDMIEALRSRAKAAAATKLAEDKYEEALVKRAEAESELAKGPSAADRFLASQATSGQAASSLGGFQVVPAKAIKPQEILENRVDALKEEARVAEETADAYFDLAAGHEAEADAKLKAANIEKAHKYDKEPKGRTPTDLTDTINKNSIKAQKKYEESVTALLEDEYAKRRKAAADRAQDENNKLREMLRKNDEYVKNVGGKYKKLTEEQKEQIEQQNAWINNTIANNLRALDIQIQKIQNEQQINTERLRRETLTNINVGTSLATPMDRSATVGTTDIAITRSAGQIEASLVAERNLLENSLALEYNLILEQNRKLTEANDEQARSEEEILVELSKKKLEIWTQYDKLILEARAQDIEDQLELVKKGSEDELRLIIAQNEIQRQLALAENVAKPAEQQVSTSVINAKFDKSRSLAEGSFRLNALEEQQSLDEAVFNEIKRSDYEITNFKLKQERDRWQAQIDLAEAGSLDWSQTQIDAAKSTVKGLERQMKEAGSLVNLIADEGIGGALLTKLGFDDDQIDALEKATQIVLDNLNELMQAEVDLAQAAVDKAKERVNAAQEAYNAEIEARNNGYANNVATAKKELQQEKKNQKEKEKILAEAQRRQELVNTITQASNLVTASTLIWSQLGFPWALPAIAVMWTSFAAAKIRAAQATKQASEEYGEGGLEFLEGGSHASGNDIDLQTKNSKGKNMRAEGGEAMAIINKRSTSKYRRQLPGIVDALNKGTFEDKYLRAFENGDSLNAKIFANETNIDLSKVETGIDAIRKQNEQKIFMLSDGRMVEVKGNVTRYYR